MITYMQRLIFAAVVVKTVKTMIILKTKLKQQWILLINKNANIKTHLVGLYPTI